eukprot:5009778-Pleurochrysis_carterae.AAC.1
MGSLESLRPPLLVQPKIRGQSVPEARREALHRRMQTPTSLQSQVRTGEASPPKQVESFTQ